MAKCLLLHDSSQSSYPPRMPLLFQCLLSFSLTMLLPTDPSCPSNVLTLKLFLVFECMYWTRELLKTFHSQYNNSTRESIYEQ